MLHQFFAFSDEAGFSCLSLKEFMYLVVVVDAVLGQASMYRWGHGKVEATDSPPETSVLAAFTRPRKPALNRAFGGEVYRW